MTTNNNKRFVTVGTVNRTKDGQRTYVKVTRTIPEGSMLSVVDPRERLTEEQRAELQENGRLTIETKSGKSFTLYDSVLKELRMPE